MSEHACIYSVLYGPGDNDKAKKAKFSDRADAFAFACGQAVTNIRVTMGDKTQKLYVWRNGDLVK